MEDIHVGAYNQLYLLGMMNASASGQDRRADVNAAEIMNEAGPSNVQELDEKYGAFYFLRDLPITLPIRTRQEFIDAHKILNDKSVMAKMADAIVKVVTTAQRLEEGRGKRKELNLNSLLCNALISRFELVYFVTKLDVHHKKLPPWFVDNLERLPVDRCFHVREVYEMAVRQIGNNEKLITKKGYVQMCFPY